MAILSKTCKPDNFELHNSLKLSFTNIRSLRSNFAGCESFLESNYPDILCETNLDDSTDFSMRGYLSLIQKDSSAYMHGLTVYVKEGLLSINPSATIFSLETLMYIIRTGLPILVELISNDLSQMVNFPTWIPDCDPHSPALLDLFLSFDTSICSTMAFPSLGNSDHVVVTVSIKFPMRCPVSLHSL